MTNDYDDDPLVIVIVIVIVVVLHGTGFGLRCQLEYDRVGLVSFNLISMMEERGTVCLSWVSSWRFSVSCGSRSPLCLVCGRMASCLKSRRSMRSSNWAFGWEEAPFWE